MMASAQVVETSVNTNNSPSQDYTPNPDDHSNHNIDSPGFKPFTVIRTTFGPQSEQLVKDYIRHETTVRQIRQQLWFNHRCKDFGLIPAGLKIKSPLNTKEDISIIKSTCRRLVKARINDCHRRLNLYKTKLQQKFDQLKQRLPTNLLNTVRSIADRRSHRSATDCRTKLGQKLSKLYNKTNRRSKPDDKWVRNISSRPLDKTETQVLAYGLKHSITPKRIPTEKIVASVEAALSRQRDLSEPVKDNIRSRVASTIQSTPKLDSKLY